eukprot:7830390-Alexandrium_andersonii.AAC.1
MDMYDANAGHSLDAAFSLSDSSSAAVSTSGLLGDGRRVASMRMPTGAATLRDEVLAQARRALVRVGPRPGRARSP